LYQYCSGRIEDAVTTCRKARSKKSLVLYGGGSGDGWHDWLAAQLLYREAEELVAGNKSEQPKYGQTAPRATLAWPGAKPW
jgi:hypothetical protein